MQMQIPLTRDLVLIGGGHAHALVLRKWGMRPLPGVRLTVINPGPTAPYSGMLPGHIAGHYQQNDLEIDLVKLARFAGARIIDGRAVALDPVSKTVTVQDHGVIEYDVASLDIGITSELPQLRGFSDHAIGAKPLDDYAEHWRGFLSTAKTNGEAGPVTVIGGGVAGVELAMAMAFALHQAIGKAEVTVIEARDQLTGIGEDTRQRLMAALKENGVTLWTGAEIAEITKDGPRLKSGEVIPSALTIGAAGALPQPWLQNTGLPLTDGFVTVGPTLQVDGHTDLFAVGDCAHMRHAPRPKAGVYAVRAAPVLHDNLRAVLTGQSLRPYHPQKDYLKLISLGGQSALAEKYRRPWSGPWLWRWKNRIDRKFMLKFQDLPAMETPTLPPVAALGVAEELGNGQPICAGCGSKVGPGALSDAISTLPKIQRDDVLTAAGDDAATLRIGGVQQVLTTDHLRAFTEDPALMARITAIHALGDIWAMGAAPQAVLTNVILPRMNATLQRRTLHEILHAAGEVFRDAGAEIVGGHSTLGSELTIGFTLTGLTETPILQSGGHPGDVLILTRPLGSGTVLAAEMQGRADGRDVMNMLGIMGRSQACAAEILHEAHAMTDVTGFGLAGHLQAICKASGTGAVIMVDDLLFYDGAQNLAEAGIRSSLYDANLAHAPLIGAQGAKGALLHDPQTAGGLLAAVAADRADGILNKLHEASVPAVRIGHLTKGAPDIICR
ncbi:selenide, water dikinase SelD [Thalassovita gelatinovora]|nr:selenide, water dikinase SelD [Thalassovita gelatinovora]QIZ82655.1 selenide, water dikinase SelD [Thalassovita gelatinovora]